MSVEPDTVHFETATNQVEKLCSLVEEALLSLSPSSLVKVGEEIGIRHGRLRTKSGKEKSKKKLCEELNSFIEKKCSESG